MQVVSCTEARNNLKSVFDSVYTDHEEVVIHRKGHENVMMISMKEYNSMKETNYLLSSPKNKENLLVSLEELREGKGFQRDRYEGIGKPKKLKHELLGCWSRKITNEHRLVYEVGEYNLGIVSCRYHYS